MMRGQTIQFSGEQDAAAILASLDDDVSIDALTWGGRTTPIFLATDHAEQRHLLGDNVVRVVLGADPFDVEAHTLTLRFPNADEAARFRVKILAGTLIVGTLAVPTAYAASQMASNAAQEQNSVAPIVAPAAVPQAAPVDKAAPVVVKQAAPVVDTPEKPGFTIQSKGTKEKTGEDNSTGSSITWVHSRNDEIK
jgi:hypothetical protein